MIRMNNIGENHGQCIPDALATVTTLDAFDSRSFQFFRKAGQKKRISSENRPIQGFKALQVDYLQSPAPVSPPAKRQAVLVNDHDFCYKHSMIWQTDFFCAEVFASGAEA